MLSSATQIHKAAHCVGGGAGPYYYYNIRAKEKGNGNNAYWELRVSSKLGG